LGAEASPSSALASASSRSACFSLAAMELPLELRRPKQAATQKDSRRERPRALQTQRYDPNG
jgi:hypothetical protein